MNQETFADQWDKIENGRYSDRILIQGAIGAANRPGLWQGTEEWCKLAVQAYREFSESA